MENQSFFRFQVPSAPQGPLVEVSYQEAETLLLKKLSDQTEDQTKALWQLAHFYKVNKQREKAFDCLRQLMQRLPTAEEKAECIFTMGQAMEQVGDFVTAARYYKEAFALEPAKTFTWYFIHNNLGFCLNKMNQFAEAENYCRKAVEIDSSRPNAYKNLGIALAGQGQYREAAQAYIAATKVDAADSRSFRLLADLVKQHPELEYEFGGDLECCRKAVEAVAKKVEAMRPVVHRGWRKQWVLLKAKIQSTLRKLHGKPPRPRR